MSSRDPGLEVSRLTPAGDPDAPYARIAAVGLVEARDSGRWLMLRALHPEVFARPGEEVRTELWGPPGGRLERGEDLEAALRREVMEETGLEVDIAGPCYAYLTMHKGERLLSVSIACRVLAETENVKVDLLEADDFRWITGEQWVAWARSGLTPWDAIDVMRVTSMARALWAVGGE